MKKKESAGEHDFLKDFDDLLISKRENAKKTNALLFFSAFVVLCSLLFMLVVYINSQGNVIVVSDKGEYLTRSNISAEKLTEVLIKNTCDIVTRKANSFDRLNYQTRIKDLALYVNPSDLNAIYLKYQTDKSYNDVIANGVVYACYLEEVKEIARMSDNRFRVMFTSILEVTGFHNIQFRIESDGEITAVTPEYPYNVTGYFFNKLEQSFSRIEEKQPI